MIKVETPKRQRIIFSLTPPPTTMARRCAAGRRQAPSGTQPTAELINWIPDSLRPLLADKNATSTTEVVLTNFDKWLVVQDPKHTEDSFHYVAWYRDDVRSLLELTPELFQEVGQLQQHLVTNHLITTPYLAFVHFPPNFWRLHLHFVDINHVFLAPPSEIFHIHELVRYQEYDRDYFISTVNLPKLVSDKEETK